MEIVHALGDLVECLGFFGGIGLLILASNKAKIDKMRAEREVMQQSLAPRGESVSAELQALREQVSAMQNTSHQFDISFDAALSRLEERVGRVETKTVAASQTEPLQRLGQG